MVEAKPQTQFSGLMIRRSQPRVLFLPHLRVAIPSAVKGRSYQVSPGITIQPHFSPMAKRERLLTLVVLDKSPTWEISVWPFVDVRLGAPHEISLRSRALIKVLARCGMRPPLAVLPAVTDIRRQFFFWCFILFSVKSPTLSIPLGCHVFRKDRPKRSTARSRSSTKMHRSLRPAQTRKHTVGTLRSSKVGDLLHRCRYRLRHRRSRPSSLPTTRMICIPNPLRSLRAVHPTALLMRFVSRDQSVLIKFK